MKLNLFASLFLISAVVVAGGCSADALLNQSASFGGSTAGRRGTTDVLFINNTEYRVTFTFGAFDDMDQDTEPEIRQYGTGRKLTQLEAGETISRTAFTCSRIFSVGGELLERAIRKNLDEDNYELSALVEGAQFAEVDEFDPDIPLDPVGQAAPVDMHLGVDFPCNSLLVIYFEENQGDPDYLFRIDYQVYPGEETR